jgi:CRISPR system Cascade subunit CasE
MYLSKIELDPLQRNTQKILSNMYEAHQLVMWGFRAYDKEEIGRVLFRIEPEKAENQVVVLVQSEVGPIWNDLPDISTKSWEPALRKGARYRFRLRANPVVTRDGKRFGLVGEEAQRRWLERKDLGLLWQDYRVIDEGYMKMRRSENREVSYKSVRYDGIVRIDDPNKAMQALIGGIGPAKGFGFGLLSLAKAQ